MKLNQLIKLCTITSALLFGCALNPAPPQLYPSPIPQTALPASRVDLRISIPIAKIIDDVEPKVPRNFGVADYNESINGGADHCCEGHAAASGVSAGWAVTRGSFELSVANAALQMSVPLEYDLRGRVRTPCCGFLCVSQCVGPLIYAGCGRGGDARRRARLTATSSITIAPTWDLQSVTTARIDAVDRCEATFVKVDITDNIMGAVQHLLDTKIPDIDAAIVALPVKQNVLAAWSAIQSPIAIADGVWLQTNLRTATIQPITQVGSELVTGVSFRATPVVTVATSAPIEPLLPLPAATMGTVCDTFQVALPVDLSFEAATTQLRSALKIADGGTRYPAQGDPYLRITNVEIFGSGSNAGVKIDFTGTAKGHLYLVGSPVYDAATDTIIIPDLDYSFETKNVLLKSADWLLHNRFREWAASQIRLSLRAEIAKIRASANAALKRQIGSVAITGNLSDLRVLSITGLVEKKLFSAQVMFSGEMHAAVR